MPDYQHIILEKDPAEHIARLTINRPSRRNPLHDAAADEMGQAIDDVAADDEIRVRRSCCSPAISWKPKKATGWVS